MKKYVYLVGLIIIPALIFSGCFMFSNPVTPSVELSRSNSATTLGIYVISKPLVVGRDKAEIGTVTLEITDYDENDDTLKVTYNTDEHWYLDEVHFHVGTSLDDFPLTKKHNPKVGNFDYKEEGLGMVREYSIEGIILPGESWDELEFAAHAKVYTDLILSDVNNEFIVSEAGSSMVYAYKEDTENLGNPVSEDYKSGSAVEAFYPSWPSISGAKWISLGDWLETIEDGDSDNHQEGWWGDYVNSWWEFGRTIDIPLNAVNILGTLTITSDNVEYIKLNSTPVGGYTEVYGDFNDSGQWDDLNTHNINLSLGSNDLNIMVRNFPRPEELNYDNPIGLIYRLDYEYNLMKEETAWAEGQDFGGNNWAMYFNFNICWSLIGNWEITAYIGKLYSGTSYIHKMTIANDSFSGTDSFLGGTGVITGTVTGNEVVWNNNYDNSDYEANIIGTIADNGTMDGSWNDNSTPSQSGVWKSTDGAAILILCN